MYVPIHIVDAIFIYAYAYTSAVFAGISLYGDLLFSTRNYGHPPHSRSLSILSSKNWRRPRILFANWSPPCRILVENVSCPKLLKCFGCWHWYCESWFASSCVKQFCAFRAVAVDVLWQHAQVFPALSKLNALKSLKFLQLAM